MAKQPEERLSVQRAIHTLHERRSKLAHKAPVASNQEMKEVLNSAREDTGATRVRSKLVLSGMSCPARLPPRLYQLADLMSVSNISLTKITGLEVLELGMLIPLVELRTLTVSACPALTAVVLTATRGEDCAQCKFLQLDFSKNPMLASVPLKAIARMPSMRELMCYGCPNLWSPPQEVASQGGKACMAFARTALQDGAVSTQMTLFLLGDGEAGKTSVFRALKSANGVAERIREDMRTVGIDTEEWHPEMAGTTQGKLSFRVFDLAGQAVYEMTHQFFLVQRAVYLFVWRAFPLAHNRCHVLTNRVQHWLESLQLRVPGACVMFVVTHIDSVDAAALEALSGAVRKTVRECLLSMRRVAPVGGRVLSVHDGGESQRVNCLLGQGIAALRERLTDFARTMPWYGELLPASFGRVRREVERLVREDNKWRVPKAAWVKLCSRCGMDGMMLSVGTKFFHETGVVRYFGDADKLTTFDDTGNSMIVYISVEFMVSVMKGFVRHDRQALQEYFISTKNMVMLRRTNRFNATGRLHESLVPFLWPKTEFSRDYWNWVRNPTQGQREAELWPMDLVEKEADVEGALGLLQGFDLMVRLKDDLELIVPGALPPSRTQVSADAFASDDNFPFSASRTYHVLPAGAFQRIVVRLAGQSEVDWSDFKFSTDRAVFYLLGNMATLARFDIISCGAAQQEKHGRIQWRASTRRLHAMIAEVVDTIERFFPGLSRLDVQEITPASAREPIQVLVLAATDMAADHVTNAVRLVVDSANATAGLKGLVVKAQGPGVQVCTSKEELGLVRVLVVCMTPEISSSYTTERQVKALLACNVSVIPVILEEFDEQWGGLQQLTRSNMIDLRACSKTHDRVEAEVHTKCNSIQCTCLPVTRQSRKPTLMMDSDEHVRNDSDRTPMGQTLEINKVVRRELMPLIMELLRTWRMRPQVSSVKVNEIVSVTNLGDDNVAQCCCAGCGHEFSRTDVEVVKKGSVSCPNCIMENRVLDLLGPPSPEVRPCPVCVRKIRPVTAHGIFSARECRLLMEEDMKTRSYAAQCRACGEHVSLFDVFPPEVYASLHITAGGLPASYQDLIRAIEAESDVVVWPSRSERGDGPDPQSWRALKLAQVVLLLVTEEYAASLECAKEVNEAIKLGKLIVPVLMPGLARCTTSFQNAGMHSADEFWRQLATYRLNTLQRRDALDWTLLSNHTPLVVSAAANDPLLMDSVACNVAARIAPLLHRAVNLAVYSDLPHHGVRLPYLRAFIEECGGQASLENMTTFEVMESFVKPRTEVSGLSMCEQLLSGGGDKAAWVARARVFLSHAWKYPFLDLVEAVERRFRAGSTGTSAEDQVVWFDVFSVSQHKSSERDFVWWNSTFLNAVGCMGEVVMVLQPWHAPVPLTRVWCIFEAYAAEATRSRFGVAMTEREAGDLVKAVCNDSSTLLAKLRRVSCEASTATKKEDQEQILDIVHQSVSFAQLDSMVIARMMEAVCAELQLRYNEAAKVGLADHQPSRLLAVLAQLHGYQGKHAEAEALHRKCLNTAGLDPDASLRASLEIAAACTRQGPGKRDEARKAYRSVLEAAAALPHDDPVRLEAAGGLALACWDQWDVETDCSLSDRLTEEWQVVCERNKFGAALRNYGLLRLAQGKLEDAERLLRARVDSLRGQFGEWSPLLPWHPHTLEAMTDVAVAADARGREAAAEEGLRGLLPLQERFLGTDHADTIAIRTRLAELITSSASNARAQEEVRAKAQMLINSESSTECSAGMQVEVGGKARMLVNSESSTEGCLQPLLIESGNFKAASEEESGTTPEGVITGLCQDLPGLVAMEELQLSGVLSGVLGLGRRTCILFAVMALGRGSASLLRVDLR